MITHPPISAEEGKNLADALRTQAKHMGFHRVGIAPAMAPRRQDIFRHWLDRGFAGVMEVWLRRHESLRAHPKFLLPNARSVVMLATDYSVGDEEHNASNEDAVFESKKQQMHGKGRGAVSRYAWGDDYHNLLRDRVNKLAAWLTRQVPGSHARGVVDSAPLAEREFAWLAGLGWFGKNTMLIHPDVGSYFFLTGLLTDVNLPADSSLEVDHCGTCTACLDACPTGALPSPRVLDAQKCISTLTIEDHNAVPEELRPGLGNWVFGCDICQDVCPWNRHAPLTQEKAFQPRNGERTLSLASILMLDDKEFKKRFHGSAILRAKRKGLARSAAIALGNNPDPDAASALEHALQDTEEVVREAAAWALRQWIEKGINKEWARDRLATYSPSDVSSTASEGSRPGASSP